MYGHAVPRREQMDCLVVFSFGQPHRLAVDECFCLAERRAEPRIIFQRPNAAVDVDCRIRLCVAGIGDRNLFIARAVRRQHFRDRAEHLRTRGVIECAQRRATFLTREFQRAVEVKTAPADCRQHCAVRRID